jgi:cbb3-type cytochrome oxidase cytochrome c subunit
MNTPINSNNKIKKTILIAGIILIATTACKTAILPVNVENETIAPAKKIIVYQVLPVNWK